MNIRAIGFQQVQMIFDLVRPEYQNEVAMTYEAMLFQLAARCSAVRHARA